jgi:hypothetical protein
MMSALPCCNAPILGLTGAFQLLFSATFPKSRNFGQDSLDKGGPIVRKAIWTALFIGLGFVPSARAQSLTAFSNQPRRLTFKQTSTTQNLAAPIPAQQSSSFSLLKYVPKLTFPSFSTSPTIGQSPFPPPGAFPSTHYKSPFQPLPPFTPKQ